MSWLSKNITYEEMIFSQTAARYSIDNTPPDLIRENLAKTAMVLQSIRNYYKRPLVVSSGYRCEELNNLVKGSRNSDHPQGFAADFTIPGVPLEHIVVTIKNTVNFHQVIIEYGRWIHLSINPQLRGQEFKIE